MTEGGAPSHDPRGADTARPQGADGLANHGPMHDTDAARARGVDEVAGHERIAPTRGSDAARTQGAASRESSSPSYALLGAPRRLERVAPSHISPSTFDVASATAQPSPEPPLPAPPDAAPSAPARPGAAPASQADTDAAREARRAALREARVVLVSACLLGEAVRYDGRSQRSEKVLAALEGKEVVPICPEVGSGLPIPRPPVDLSGGTGVDVWAGRARALEREARVDRTEDFQRGARLALEATRRFGITVALLKEKSPSCGSQRVYESGTLRPGEGITTALLRAEGLTVLSDEDL